MNSSFITARPGYCQGARPQTLVMTAYIKLRILYIRKFLRGFYFRETSQIESSLNGEITLLFADKVNHALIANFTLQVCL